MGWFILKNRRHVGPYTKEQLAALRQQGQADPQDYVIAQEHADAGELVYKRLYEVIGGPVPAARPGTPLSAGGPRGGTQANFFAPKSSTPPPPPRSPAAAAQDNSYERPLGTFSDED